MRNETMHMYDSNDRKVAELDISKMSGAQIANLIEIQEILGRSCVHEEDGIKGRYFRDENGDWRMDVFEYDPCSFCFGEKGSEECGPCPHIEAERFLGEK